MSLFTLYIVNKSGGLVYSRVRRLLMRRAHLTHRTLASPPPTHPLPTALAPPPQDLTPTSAKMSGNEVLMAASTFHSLHAISKQLAPVPSGGIAAVEAPSFTLHCFESPTGVKFFVTAKPKASDAPAFLRRVYEFYGDYVLKVGGWGAVRARGGGAARAEAVCEGGGACGGVCTGARNATTPLADRCHLPITLSHRTPSTN